MRGRGVDSSAGKVAERPGGRKPIHGGRSRMAIPPRLAGANFVKTDRKNRLADFPDRRYSATDLGTRTEGKEVMYVSIRKFMANPADVLCDMAEGAGA